MMIPYFNGNPLYGFDYVEELKELYPEKDFNTPKDVLDLIVIRMRDDGWSHFNKQGDEKYLEGFLETNPCDLPCMFYTTGGGDLTMSYALYALLQSHNIPSSAISAYLSPPGHSGILYPSLELSMGGNYVFDTWIKGYNYKIPNLLPVNLTYDNYNTEYLVWMEEPTYCMREYHAQRKRALNYLNQYNHPTGKYDVLYAYCFYPISHYDIPLLEGLMETSILCQDENPGQDNYHSAILTTEEIEEWNTKLNASVQCVFSPNWKIILS